MPKFIIIKNKTRKRVNKRNYKKQYKLYMYKKALLQGYPVKGLKKFISNVYCNQGAITEMREYLEEKLQGEIK